MAIASFLKAQQNEMAAYSAVVIHNIGRCFGVLWTQIYFFLFPVEYYGFVFGSVMLISQPFTLFSVLILGYNTKNDDYSVMNYMLGVLVALVLVVCIACYSPVFQITSDLGYISYAAIRYTVLNVIGTLFATNYRHTFSTAIEAITISVVYTSVPLMFPAPNVSKGP